jgi:hypothetical protein
MKFSQSYSNLKKNEKQFQAVTGVSLAVFENLSHFFNEDLNSYYQHFTMDGGTRKRKMSVRKDGVLCKTEDKLCFILSYLKNNTLQETHASNWGMKQPQCNLWIHFLLQRLFVTLEGMQLVPAEDSESLMKLLETVQTLYLDGTERSIQRPLHKEEQKRHYSGKKNAYREA